MNRFIIVNEAWRNHLENREKSFYRFAYNTHRQNAKMLFDDAKSYLKYFYPNVTLKDMGLGGVGGTHGFNVTEFFYRIRDVVVGRKSIEDFCQIYKVKQKEVDEHGQ